MRAWLHKTNVVKKLFWLIPFFFLLLTTTTSSAQVLQDSFQGSIETELVLGCCYKCLNGLKKDFDVIPVEFFFHKDRVYILFSLEGKIYVEQSSSFRARKGCEEDNYKENTFHMEDYTSYSVERNKKYFTELGIDAAICYNGTHYSFSFFFEIESEMPKCSRA